LVTSGNLRSQKALEVEEQPDPQLGWEELEEEMLMKPISTFVIVAGLAAFSSQPSSADCVDMTGSGNQEAHAGLAKDGTHAPLETTAAAQAQPGPAVGTTTGSQAAPPSPQKDGGQMPMNESPNIATSAQDAQAQQKGDKTAAAVANDKKC
jgi:hypothetical protein